MANSYYAPSIDFVPRSKVKSQDLDDALADIEAGFDAVEADVDAAVTTANTELLTWPSNIDANSKTLTGLPTPAVASAAATKSWVEAQIAAEILAGGTPGDIPITDLGIGTATAEQSIEVNAAGTTIVGADRRAEHAAANLYAHASLGGL